MKKRKDSAQMQTLAVSATMRTDVENRRAHPVLLQNRTAQAEKTKENKYGKTKGGVGVTGIAMQLSGRFGPGLDALLQRLAGYKRAITKALGRDGGRPLQEWRKLLSLALARCSATGHKALRGA